MESGADACLYMGPKITNKFSANLLFGHNGYQFALEPTPDNRLVFAQETTTFGTYLQGLGSGHAEARLKDLQSLPGSRGAEHGVPY
jgi:hypothetical protein